MWIERRASLLHLAPFRRLATKRATSPRGARRVPLHTKNEERRTSQDEPLLVHFAPCLRVASFVNARDDNGFSLRVLFLDEEQQQIGEVFDFYAADFIEKHGVGEREVFDGRERDIERFHPLLGTRF